MKHVIKIHLEHTTNVIRDIEIPSEKSLKDLHYIIIDALELDKNEMASFYMTNEQFELLQEIPLFKIDEKDNSMLDMSEITIASVFPNIDSQLIYVYDFLKMWRFLISYSKETKNKSKTIDVTNSIGKMPKEAPEIVFETKKEFDPFDDAFENFDKFNEPEY
ncbi:MAG: hypothetical protein VX762_01735 [Bacteroidota bacterium]|nr:hypothetical protein [Bacteroidota bacterium]